MDDVDDDDAMSGAILSVGANSWLHRKTERKTFSDVYITLFIQYE